MPSLGGYENGVPEPVRCHVVVKDFYPNYTWIDKLWDS